MPARDLSFPGEPPYTRGIHPDHVSHAALDHAAVRGFRDRGGHQPALSLSAGHGQTGLSTAFDLPTLMGYDSDHPLAEGEVGNAAWPSVRWRTWKCSSIRFRWRM